MEFGLEINNGKSKALIFKANQEERATKEIEGIEVVKSLRYLGLEICNEIDIFRLQKEKMIEELRILANRTYSATENSFNRILIGKLWWKSLALPKALFGLGVMTMHTEQIEEMQVIENKVYRTIMRARELTAMTAVRGEIGASTMKSRVRESTILLAKSILEANNELVREILQRATEGTCTNWGKKLKIFLKEVRMNFNDLEEMEKKHIRKRIREVDTEEWKKEMGGQSTMKMYMQWKKEIREEGIYDNRESSIYLFKARANALEVNSRIHFLRGGDRKCELCGNKEENLVHFLMECEHLKEERSSSLIEEYKGETSNDTVGNLLFKTKRGDVEELKEMIQKMWKRREKGIEEIEQKEAQKIGKEVTRVE